MRLTSLCKEVDFSRVRYYNKVLVCQSVFIPRVISNCELWTKKHHKLQKQLRKYLGRMT